MPRALKPLGDEGSPGPLSPLAALQRQLEATPDDHEVRLALARALVQAGRVEDALAHYEALAALVGPYLSKVIADLEALLRASPSDRALREFLGDAYARAGRFQDAMMMYRWPVEHDESNDVVGG